MNKKKIPRGGDFAGFSRIVPDHGGSGGRGGGGGRGRFGGHGGGHGGGRDRGDRGGGGGGRQDRGRVEALGLGDVRGEGVKVPEVEHR